MWNIGPLCRMTAAGFSGSICWGSLPETSKRLCTLAMTERWARTAALGSPVVPAVKMMTAGSFSSPLAAGADGGEGLSVQRRTQGQNTFGAASSIEYTVPIAIPEHSSKRFTTAVFFPPFFDQLQVQLISGQQLLYKDSVALQRIDPSAVSCGVLASCGSGSAAPGP